MPPSLPQAIIVLPTYNEADNIGKLLPRLVSIAEELTQYDMHILVVDDTSPDGTAGIVRKHMKRSRRIHLLMGEKQGLGMAYIRGFKHAIRELKADVLFEMDADFSHDPKYLTQFLEALDDGKDFVIGSRYILGGAVPDWGLSRKAISAGGNFFARIVAGLYSVHDCTSGYRCIRAALIKRIDLDALNARGYAFQMNLLFEAHRLGARIGEIPIVFYDRKVGKSKISKDDIMEFFSNSFRLRWEGSRRFVKFCLVGLSGVLVNLGVLICLAEGLDVAKEIASAGGILVSIFTNFLFNEFWTFQDRRCGGAKGAGMRVLQFYAVSFVGAAVQWGVFLLGYRLLAADYRVSQLIGIGIATFWNYFVNKMWTWSKGD
ncbi:glycosyltransferase family 2 protein [Candidatus Woesearchaeota archaeon]|nr:glycosyltransferase family 2 protein [Candidatus Woesearchaeota archaeon]